MRTGTLECEPQKLLSHPGPLMQIESCRVRWQSVASAMCNACETAHTSRVHNDRCPREACHTEYVSVCCREQEKREERQRLKEQGVVLEDDPHGVGSFDDGDPHTTNLYIGGHLLTIMMTRPPALARLKKLPPWGSLHACHNHRSVGLNSSPISFHGKQQAVTPQA